jgi:hypothetical protein
MTTLDITATSAEAAAHLSDANRLQVLTDAVALTAQNKPVTAKYKAGFHLVDVLRAFRVDQTIDVKLSTLLGCVGDHTRAEIAKMVAGRNSILLSAAPLTFDEGIALERQSLGKRQG